MPRSSRSKSHKQSKHSSKEAAASTSTSKEYSASDEDVKMKERSSNGGKEDVVPVRLSKDYSVSGERVKHGKDLSAHGNGDVSEEHTASVKRREEKIHGGSDRWNGGSSDDKGLLVNIENKESLKLKDSSKVSEPKSKSNRRHDSDAALEKDESKSGSGNRGEKRKSEKDSGRKESSQHKEHKESKDKDRVSDRGKKAHSDKLGAEASSKQVEIQSSKRGKGITEWPIEEELRNPELERELEKRMRRRGEASSDRDRYQDEIKDTDDRRLSTRSDRSREERHKHEEYRDIRETRPKEEKLREDGERDRKNRDAKHQGESERYSKHRDDRYREDKYSEDGNKETKYKDDKYFETGDKDERSRDGKRKQDDDRDYRHKEEKRGRDSKYRDIPEAKRLRDDNAGTDLHYRKMNNRDGSPVYDLQVENPVRRYSSDLRLFPGDLLVQRPFRSSSSALRQFPRNLHVQHPCRSYSGALFNHKAAYTRTAPEVGVTVSDPSGRDMFSIIDWCVWLDVMEILYPSLQKPIKAFRGLFGSDEDVLRKHGRDLTELAEKGKLQPVIGWNEEKARCTEILCRRIKNNPVMLSEDNVGPMAIAEGIAQMIVEGDVPDPLIGCKLISLKTSDPLLEGERLQEVINKVAASNGKIILFIDQIHTLVGTDAEVALGRGELRCIGATTIAQYRKYIKRGRAVECRFEKVVVDGKGEM